MLNQMVCGSPKLGAFNPLIHLLQQYLMSYQNSKLNEDESTS